MFKIPIKIHENGNELPLPAYATPQSAGLDLMAAISKNQILKPRERLLIPAGISIALPKGYEGQIRPRSGLALKHGITVLNTPGTIDADYRGEVKVILINFSDVDFIIERGMRIAQLVISSHSRIEWETVEQHEDIDSTGRDGGFGSSGTKALAS